MGITEEYRTISEGAGLLSRSHFGRLEFAGPDVIGFLQGLLTNDVAGLRPGRGAYAAYLTQQGRMIADLELHALEGKLLAEVAPATAEALASRFDQLIFTEDVRVSDVSSSTSSVVLVGRSAAGVTGAAFGVSVQALDELAEPDHIVWAGGIISRGGDALLPIFKVFSTAGDDSALATAVLRAGAVVASDGLADALRIEAGRTRFGVDSGPETIPLEAGLLDRAISTSKGCYVGQEIIIRMLHRGGGRVAKRFVTMAISGTTTPAAGLNLVAESREVGKLTSVAPSMTSAGFIGLGYLQRDYAEIGKAVNVGTGTNLLARVTGFAK